MQRVKIDKILRGLIGLLLVALVYTIYAGIHQRVIGVGDTAPSFAITTDSGRAVAIPDFGGKLLVLNFWASWCPPCLEEMPSMNQFAKDFAGSGVVVLGISVDKDEKAYKTVISRVRPTFQIVRDPETKINADYGTFQYPETYIINPEGKVIQKIIGPADWTDPKMTGYIK